MLAAVQTNNSDPRYSLNLNAARGQCSGVALRAAVTFVLPPYFSIEKLVEVSVQQRSISTTLKCFIKIYRAIYIDDVCMLLNEEIVIYFKNTGLKSTNLILCFSVGKVLILKWHVKCTPTLKYMKCL